MEWYPVRMRFPAITVDDTELLAEEQYEDAIRATSAEDALEQAKWNWPTATDIEILSA